MKYVKILLLGGLSAMALVAIPGTSDAARYNNDCRNFTKSVRINGRMQTAHAKACPVNGSEWEVVSFNGHRGLYDRIYNQAYTSINHRGRYNARRQQIVLYDFIFPTRQYARGHGRNYRRGYHRYNQARNNWSNSRRRGRVAKRQSNTRRRNRNAVSFIW